LYVKLIVLILLAVSLPLCGGAARGEEVANSKISIIFLGWYDKELVELYLADNKIFSSKITTDPTSGTSGYVDVKVNKPTGIFTVKIPRLKLAKVTTIDFSKGKYLYISLQKHDVSFEQTSTPLALD